MSKKSSAKRFPYQKNDKRLFKDVVFIVEATHHEQFCFWQDYFYKPKYPGGHVEKWDQVSMGKMIQIGELDNRPINIIIGWAILEGYRIMFYEAVSQVVDHAMIDEWIKHWTLKTVRWDNDSRWAHCDSNNFHHCIHHIEHLVKTKGLGKADPYDHTYFND